jgi:hypothetical protein
MRLRVHVACMAEDNKFINKFVETVWKAYLKCSSEKEIFCIEMIFSGLGWEPTKKSL